MSTSEKFKYTLPVIKLNQPDDHYKFRPLPKAAGADPYRLSLTEFGSVDQDKLVFHMVGDTGGIKKPDFQRKVAAEMSQQIKFAKNEKDQARFLYHLGDIVYHHGERSGYYDQFFSPYRHYPRPVFAIAGNHDSDVNPESEVPYESLDAFLTVFCNTRREKIDFSADANWESMIQPNVYWTLQSPLANIIGLYSNVPKYGVITEEQRKWFVNELQAAALERPHKALIICLHHAPYSADFNHGSSLSMIAFLEGVFSETGIRPDIVFSGHVHNYQRFTKQYPDGAKIPYIVAGAGGFDELHSLAEKNDPGYSVEHRLLRDVTLEHYCDDQHGFLKLILERSEDGLTLTGEYYAIPHQDIEIEATLNDRFTIHI